MKILYTSYYANRNLPKDMNKIPISRIPPKWFKGSKPILKLSPSKKLLLDYKNKKIGIGEYIRRFKEETGTYIPEEFKLKDFDVLLCYEKPEDFCHRHLVAEELSKSGDLVIEYKPELKIYLDLSDPMEGFYPHIISQLLADILDRLAKYSTIILHKKVKISNLKTKNIKIEKFNREDADLIIKTVPAINEKKIWYNRVPYLEMTYRRIPHYQYNDMYPKLNVKYPIKKVFVYGSKDFSNPNLIIGLLNSIPNKFIIADNNSIGANKISVGYAKFNNLKIKEFPSNGKIDKKSILKRNEKIVKWSDLVIIILHKNSSHKELINICKDHNKPFIVLSEDKNGIIKEDFNL